MGRAEFWAVSLVMCRDIDDVVVATQQALRRLAGQYHQLVVLVGLSAEQVAATSADLGCTEVAVGLIVAGRLVELPPAARPLGTKEALQQAVAAAAAAPVLLDRIEVLFEPSLATNPLALLRDLSRARPLVVVWPGGVDGDNLVYARPGHPEYRRDASKDLLVIVLNVPASFH